MLPHQASAVTDQLGPPSPRDIAAYSQPWLRTQTLPDWLWAHRLSARLVPPELPLTVTRPGKRLPVTRDDSDELNNGHAACNHAPQNSATSLENALSRSGNDGLGSLDTPPFGHFTEKTTPLCPLALSGVLLLRPKTPFVLE